MKNKLVTIKTASMITGMTIKSIRYYEERGLIKPTRCTQSGYRLYSNEDIYLLQRIKYYKELKLSLEEIAEIMESSEVLSPDLIRKKLYHVQREIEDNKRTEIMLKTALYQQEEKLFHDGDAAEGIAVLGLDLQNDIKIEGALPCRRFYTLFNILEWFYKKMRAFHVPIIYICDCHEKGKDKELEIWADHMLEGTWGAQIIDELSPEPQDYVIKKKLFNGFIHTDLQQVLFDLKVNTLIMTGWRTHVCVAQTAIEAFHRNYRVIVARDAVNSTTQREHEFGLDLMDANYGFQTCSCKEIVERLEKTGRL